MKLIPLKSLISSVLLIACSNQLQAASFIQTSGPNWEVGIGSYAMVIDDDNEREELAGGSALASFIFNDYFAVRGVYYSVKNDSNRSFDLSGYEMNAYMGTGLKSTGFKAYGGFGFYKETLENGNTDEDISGAQLSGGIGYNWSNVALDLTMSARTVGDYADYFDEDDDDVTAVSGLLSVAFRF